jgi:hypothetical protein
MNWDESYVPWILRAWWSRRGLRWLVAVLVFAGIVDVTYSWMLMRALGSAGELNPAVRHFYQEGLVVVWLVLNILASLVGSVILGSLVTSSNFHTRKTASTGLSFLLSLRFATSSIALASFYLSPWFRGALVVAACFIFLTVRKYLADGYIISRQVLYITAVEWYVTMHNSLTSIMSYVRSLTKLNPHTSRMTAKIEPTASRSLSTQEKKRLLGNVLTLIVVVSLLLGLLSVLQDAVFKATPWWIRELGLVTKIQARAFLVAFVAILAGMAVLFYVLSSIFEIVSGQSRG